MNINCYNSVGLAVKLNKEAKTPFPLYFTGVSSEIQEWLKTNYLIDETGANFPVEITGKHQMQFQKSGGPMRLLED